MMTNIPCLYAIVRFCPYVETEEFANVGIVMLAAESRVFDFKLMNRRHARVTNFFEQLDGAVFKGAIANLRCELDRIKEMIQTADTKTARALFDEITRPRETVIKFSAPRGALVSDPEVKLAELFGYYVERDFVTREYRETVLERRLRQTLIGAGFSERFEKLEVGNDEYHAVFPFVEHRGDVVLKAIKPLNLTQDQPSKILDHGGQWLSRIERLAKKELLPRMVLFAVEGPPPEDARIRAYSEIIEDLKDAGATVLPFEDKDRILEFAAS